MVINYLPVILFFGFLVFFGSSNYYSPWRCVWRVIPSLNNFMPDLNGVWVGSTQSNWPKIDIMRKLSNCKDSISIDEIELIEEQFDAIAMEIKCSFFEIIINSSLSKTESASTSLMSKILKTRGNFRIYYTYDQTTPEPKSSDEGSHIGSAYIDYNPTSSPDELEGMYWTRRSWKQGLNTAGRLVLKRVSVKHASPDLKLCQLAKEHIVN